MEDRQSEYQINLIQSLIPASGVGLVSTYNQSGIANLAVFNKVLILGSNPPLMGIFFRPLDRERHTYENIKNTGKAGWNAFTIDQIHKAHRTARHYPSESSEFEHCDLQKQYEGDGLLPYVKNSPVRIELSFSDEHIIKQNDTRLLVMKMTQFFIDERLLIENGTLNHQLLSIAMSVGQNAYARSPSELYIPEE